MSYKPRKSLFERLNSKGQNVEVIEETLPGKKEKYGKMERKTPNHNTYVSVSTIRPGERRYREIIKDQGKKKKEETIMK